MSLSLKTQKYENLKWGHLSGVYLECGEMKT